MEQPTATTTALDGIPQPTTPKDARGGTSPTQSEVNVEQPRNATWASESPEATTVPRSMTGDAPPAVTRFVWNSAARDFFAINSRALEAEGTLVERALAELSDVCGRRYSYRVVASAKSTKKRPDMRSSREQVRSVENGNPNRQHPMNSLRFASPPQPAQLLM